jgi:deoxyuridine 5'-triphosphate nucleotidohydrolase
MEKLLVKKLFSDAILPKRQTLDSAGYDICSYSDYTILPGSKQLIDTGISFTVPEGTYGQLAPRSGMSCKGTHIGAGVIDRDYTGHVKVLLFNLNKVKSIDINKGERVAQLLIKRISLCDVEEVEELSSTSRGSDGFGSTGS